MNINVILEFRFFQDNEGTVYTDSSFEYIFWQRYLMSFSSVTIVARAKQIHKEDIKPQWKQVTGQGVHFIALPYYHGLADLLVKLPRVLKAVKHISLNYDSAFLFRMPSFISALFLLVNKKLKKSSYGVEMVGDPEEVFSSLPKAYQLIGIPFVRFTKKIIKNAVAVTYVERIVLPVKYKASNPSAAYFISDIILPEESLKSTPRINFSPGEHLDLITIGSLEQMYKAPDVVLKALSEVKNKGLSFKLIWIGGGIYLNKMKELAIDLGIQNDVLFKGTITDRREINSYLEKADIFFLASRTEGLPRVILEAMSKALPCIGTKVGGIPELIESPYLFEKDNIPQFVNLLQRISNRKSELLQMSHYSIAKVKNYTNAVLDVERKKFYDTILVANK